MGRQRRTGPSRKFVAALPPTTKRNTKSQEEEDIPTRDNLPSRPTSRNSRRVRGLPPSPLPSAKVTPTIAASAPKAKAPPKSKQRSKAKSRKRNEPPPPYPGHNSAVDTAHPESSDNQLTRTETYIDNTTQPQYQDVTGEKATQTERQDTTGDKTTQTERQDITGEKATQTEHEDPTRERPTRTDHQDLIGTAARSVYSDPTERWVMANAQPGQPAVADAAANVTLSGQTTVENAPQIEPIRGQPAHQPPPNNQVQMHKQKNQEGSASKAAGSSPETEGGSSKDIYKRSDFANLLQGRFRKVKLFMREYSKSSEEGVDETTRLLLKSLEAESHSQPSEPQYQAVQLAKLVTGVSIKNEVIVVHELHDLVCPSAERLSAIYCEDERLRPIYRLFVECRDEPWTKTRRPVQGLKDPRPDYCVGFSDQAFEDDELDLLAAAPGIMSSFTATGSIYFPFLTCEAKSPRETTTSAENQNAYSMMVAVSSVVKLFRAAKMESSVHRKVMGFSISYNDKTVVLDGYYPVIAGSRLDIYRTRRFIMAISPSTTDAWKSWRFVRNIYELWAPKHLETLRMAIKALTFTVNVPDLVSRDSKTPTPSESAHLGLQQLGLRSPTPRTDTASVFSDESREKRAMTAPIGGESPKRRKTAMV